MPMRGEFEAEYDNNAEFIIKDLSFDDDDTPEERGPSPPGLLHSWNSQLFQKFTLPNILMFFKT
jgi:hypothetical protein